jgi:hypothetical protein
MRSAIGLNTLVQIRIDSLNKLITALCDDRSLAGKDELQKRHEHPDGYNGKKDAAQDKERVKQYASLVLG